MTPQEIKANAPDGATHYDDDIDYYKLDSNGKYLIWNDEDDMGFWDHLYCCIEVIELKPLS